MDKNMIDPNNKCGYESIWVALKCKNSPLIDKYNLIKMTDLYSLLRYGNNQYPSLFEQENVKKFYEKRSERDKNMFDEFKNERFNTNSGVIWHCYYPLIAIYLNIEIILMDKNEKKLEMESSLIKYALDESELNPEERIILHLTKYHVEYMPEDNEIEIFENLKKKLKFTKESYDNTITINQWYPINENDWLEDDGLFSYSNLLSDLENIENIENMGTVEYLE